MKIFIYSASEEMIKRMKKLSLFNFGKLHTRYGFLQLFVRKI